MSNAREYYFLVYIELEKKNDPKQMKFSTENKSLTLLSYKTLSKEEKNKLFLLFKYADVDVGKKKIDIKFKCYDKDYILTFTKEEANFIFKVDFEYYKFNPFGLRDTKIPQDILSKEDWELCYQGDDGTFTYFVDLVENEFAKSSTSDIIYCIDNKTNDEMFKLIQELTNYKELIIGYADKYDHEHYGIDFSIKIYDDYNE